MAVSGAPRPKQIPSSQRKNMRFPMVCSSEMKIRHVKHFRMGTTAWAGFAMMMFWVARCPAQEAEDFYIQKGTDKSFAEVMKSGDLPRGRNSTTGFKGSRVRINAEFLRDGPNSRRKIPRAIRIHTLGHSAIPRRDFSKWSRWYQEDGNTQIFRLFEGEENVRNSRKLAARIEAFSDVKWKKGDWHVWVGTYTIIKPHRCAIFQSKNNINDWSVQLNMNDQGDVRLNHRRGKDKNIARDMVGKPFHIRVRDNGLEYEVFLNGKKVGSGSYARPKGETNFRWGMYLGGTPLRHDAMILVTGAEVDPRKVDESGLSDPGESGEPAAEVVQEAEEDPTPEGLAIPERIWTNKDGETVTAPGVYKVGEDFFSIRVGEKWIAYPLEDLADEDRKALLQAMDFIEP